jgi:hypothetical protein
MENKERGGTKRKLRNNRERANQAGKWLPLLHG